MAQAPAGWQATRHHPLAARTLPRDGGKIMRIDDTGKVIAGPLYGVFMLENLDSILLALEHTAQVRSVTLEDGSVQLIGAPL